MSPALTDRDPVTELTARERARALLDKGTFRELIDPFEQLASPHLLAQGITPQSDDGVVVARGTLDGERAVVLAVDGDFQGGGIGEVSGAKIAGALELALRDAGSGRPVRPVLLLETGGIRLQEANLGLLAIAEIHAAIAALRRHVPVVGVITGMIGAYGGMGIAAGLCSDLVMTAAGRLALNGPEVIENEAGVAELDSRDRGMIWAYSGGSQRTAVGLADVLVPDDTTAVRDAVRAVFARGPRPDAECRSARVEEFTRRLAGADPALALDPQWLRAAWGTADGRGEKQHDTEEQQA
ncbi:biotin-independent malonate decarboxylase subunit beta [Streptomyces sp. NPDC059740]|uniref:biotin-independent malonate decarboxylase subunit beta n=1 Tax=Streptomyces sp. NPDC059740 TaxID=3346926 RepID=UPI00365DA901